MKYFTKFFILLTLFFLSFQLSAQKKIALVVAVGKYPTNQRNWKNLSSVKDLQYIREALLQNGFALKDIDTLVNEKATKAAMVKALDNLALKANKDDIVFFHFSGHGQQIQDDEKDGCLDEVDGYDEALIPYDAKAMWDDADYHGEKHFRDDLLEEKLNAVRKKVGNNGSVVVVVDACHSGTITRSAGSFRGTPVPCQKNNYKPNVNLSDLKCLSNTMFDQQNNDMGCLVVFSGSSPNQVNKETKDEYGKNVGALSYAFAKAITTLTPNCNYRTLFEKVKSMIQADEPTQIPMFEGNGNLKVFANQYIPTTERIIANMAFYNKENGFNDTMFIINKGLFNNVNIGTTLKLFVQGSENVYCKAIVQSVNNFQSICVADKKLIKNEVYVIKIDDLMYGKIASSFLIQNKAKATRVENQLLHFLKPNTFLKVDNNPDYTISILPTGNKYEVQLIEKNDSIRFTSKFLKEDTLSTADMENIVEEIKQGMRVKYLRKMQDGGSLANFIDFKIIPYKVKSSVDSNELILKQNDSFKIQIHSKYDGILYYTILDLMPDNTVKVLLPDSLEIAEDYSLRKEQKVQRELYTDFTSLTGKEFLKIIVSLTPLDLRPSFSSVKRRGTAKSLEKVMDELFIKNKKTATSRAAVNLDEVGIVTVSFTLQRN